MAVEQLSDGSMSPYGGILGQRRALVSFAIAIALLAIAWQCGRYLLQGTYLDHIEGNVVISGWQYYQGAALYQMIDGNPVFATFYGPLAYLLEVPALAIFGAGVATSKITSLLALSATIGVMAWHLRDRSASGQARDGMLLLVAGLLLFSPISYWVRPDPIETLLVAIGLTMGCRRGGAVSVGVCIGLAVNLKVHAFFYFLPVVVDVWASSGWRAVAKIVITSGVIFLLPFLAPGISLHDYVAMLAMQVGRRANTIQPLIGQIGLGGIPAVLLTATLLGAARRTAGRERLYFCSVLATLALLVYPASFPGAGFYHLAPFVPVLADAFNRLQRDHAIAQWTPILLCAVALAGSPATLRLMDQLKGSDIIADEALALARREPGRTIQVGYGDNIASYQTSQLSKAVLALNGYPAVLDAQVLMELRFIHIDASTRWIPDLAACRFGTWLLPKDEQPFAVTSYYDAGPLFGDDFRRAFLDHYRRVDSTEHFDVWTCASDHETR